ncbi:MAG: ABC transporter substrate-binding protein [Gemmatimonadaceae bacterium]
MKAWPRFFCDGVTCAAVIFAFTACRSGEDPASARGSTLVYLRLERAAWNPADSLPRPPAAVSRVLLRRALTLAIDRPELARRLTLPPESPITDAPRTFRQARRGEFPEALPYYPDEARRLLDAAGWVDRNGDGVREREGRPFRYTAKVRSGDGVPQLAVYVQDYLRRVGVQMEVVMLEDALMWKKLLDGDFEALFFRHQPGPGAQRRDFGRANRIGYQSPWAFEVIDRLMATADPDEEDRLYGELAKIFRAELPLTRLVWKSEVTFAHRRVLGLSTPFRADANTHMENLRVDGER